MPETSWWCRCSVRRIHGLMVLGRKNQTPNIIALWTTRFCRKYIEWMRSCSSSCSNDSQNAVIRMVAYHGRMPAA